MIDSVVMYGTNNMVKEPAMTREQCEKAMEKMCIRDRIWTILYVLLAISFAYAITRLHAPKGAAAGYILNIIINALWSPVFFMLYNPVSALVIMIALVVNLIILMRNVRQVTPSFYLLIPYLIWLAIATILNVSVIVLN